MDEKILKLYKMVCRKKIYILIVLSVILKPIGICGKIEKKNWEAILKLNRV